MHHAEAVESLFGRRGRKGTVKLQPKPLCIWILDEFSDNERLFAATQKGKDLATWRFDEAAVHQCGPIHGSAKKFVIGDKILKVEIEPMDIEFNIEPFSSFVAYTA
jgi:hypothetical protein